MSSSFWQFFTFLESTSRCLKSLRNLQLVRRLTWGNNEDSYDGKMSVVLQLALLTSPPRRLITKLLDGPVELEYQRSRHELWRWEVFWQCAQKAFIETVSIGHPSQNRQLDWSLPLRSYIRSWRWLFLTIESRFAQWGAAGRCAFASVIQQPLI